MGRDVEVDIGLVFDIDGVLVHGRKPLPGGPEAITWCVTASIPHVFLTNNAMDLEADRASVLSSILNVDIDAERMIVAHTPLADEAALLKDDGLVLVTGYTKRDLKDIMKSKGLKKVKTVAEFAAERPYLLPNKLYPGRSRTALDDPDIQIPIDEEKVAAIVIVENPTEWNEDLQIIVDLLRSDGRLAHPSPTQVVELYCCNFDFVFATGFAIPRFGPGAFMKCLQQLFYESTGRSLTVHKFGKPYRPAYITAEHKLALQTPTKTVPKTIYAVGDNPKSDIRGARNAGPRYRSILVRTGVFNMPLDNDPDDPADYVVNNVAEAMELIRQLHNL